MRTLARPGDEPIGLDVKSSPFTHLTGSIADREVVKRSMRGVDVVLHTATLHKPHIETHSQRAFVDTNIGGTLNLLEEAAAQGAKAFVFTSSTSVFGRALVPPPGEPAVWITEDIAPVPKNIYGVTKLAAEHLCELAHRRTGMPCLILRTSRFFPDPDDNQAARARYSDDNRKANEFLHRRVDLEDVVAAHLLAASRAPVLGFDRLIISATTPFARTDLTEVRADLARVVRRHCPAYQAQYARRGWSLPDDLDRVYVNDRARERLGWKPTYDFKAVIQRLCEDEDYRSPLAKAVGSKLYHAEPFADGPYPVAER